MSPERSTALVALLLCALSFALMWGVFMDKKTGTRLARLVFVLAESGFLVGMTISAVYLWFKPPKDKP